ncbi:MAG TPA: DUF3157 family protein [Rubrivivax sp.]|nr:DUF3157 family protein [Rubrivivax sp.]
MTIIGWRPHSLGILVLALLVPAAAWADFEVVDAQGRRILLKDDGTWSYLTPAAQDPAAPATRPTVELSLARPIDMPGGCRFDLTLANTLPYEIRSLVPTFTVFRASGVAYSSKTASFGPVRPGDSSRRALQFNGIACAEITRLQVSGGDRCEMDDLNKFSDVKGECLARVRLLPNEWLPFEKSP